MYGQDWRLNKANMLEDQAKILRKEVEREDLMKTEGMMSEAYKSAMEELSEMRILWSRMYGGSYF